MYHSWQIPDETGFRRASPVPIGVIDLKQGRAVRAIAGERAGYLPLESGLCDTGDAVGLAASYHALGIHELYVADLDAIGGGRPQAELWTEISHHADRVWLDAGVAELPQAIAVASIGDTWTATCTMVIGLESLTDPGQLPRLVQQMGPARLAFSLDLRDGQPMVNFPAWQAWTPRQIVEHVVAIGVCRLVILDLAAVGTGQGCPTLAFCRDLRRDFPQLEIVTGGGIRDPADIVAMSDACDGLLLGSVLYDGKYPP